MASKTSNTRATKQPKANAKAAAKNVEPVPTEPAHVEPVHAEPAHVEPVHVEPAHAEPVHAEPVHADPVVATPAETDAVAAPKPKAKRQSKKAAAKAEGEEVVEKVKQPKKTECVGFVFNGIARAKNVVFFQCENVDQVNEFVKETFYPRYGLNTSGKYVRCASANDVMTALVEHARATSSFQVFPDNINGRAVQTVHANESIKDMSDLLKKLAVEKEAHLLVLRPKDATEAKGKKRAPKTTTTSTTETEHAAAEADAEGEEVYDEVDEPVDEEMDDALEEEPVQQVQPQPQVNHKENENKKHAEGKPDAHAHQENNRLEAVHHDAPQKVGKNASAGPRKTKQAQKTH